MSANRKQAFARTPRGAQANSAGNSRGSIRIDKSFLEALTAAQMAPEVSTVLTRTGASIVITIGSNGKGEYKFSRPDGSVIGDQADMQKIQTLGSFINEERKNVLKSSVSNATRKFLAAMVGEERGILEVPQDRTISFSKGFVDVFRVMQNQISILQENMEKISSLPNVEGENERIQRHLIDSGTRSQIAAMKFLVHRATIRDGEEPRKLNEFLKQEHVMSWVFTKLSAQKLQMNTKGFELRHVYFPKDPTKGLSVLFHELGGDLKNHQLGVLDGLAPFRAMFEDSGFIRSFLNIPQTWDVADFGPQSEARVLANVPILVPPYDAVVNIPELMEVLGKQGDRGLSWSAGNGFAPADILKFLGTIPKRVRSFAIDHSMFRMEVFQEIFTGFTYDATVEHRGVFMQLRDWMKNGHENVVGPMRGYNAVLIQGLIRGLMGVPRRGDRADHIVRVIPEQIVPFGGGTVINPATNTWVAIKHEAQRLSLEAVQQQLGTGRLEVNIGPKEKEAKDDAFRSARIPLGDAAKELLRELKTKRYVALAERVGIWLRTFLTVPLQDAVAYAIHSRLQAFLASPVDYGQADFAAHFDAAADFNWADEVTEEERRRNEAEDGGVDVENPDDE